MVWFKGNYWDQRAKEPLPVGASLSGRSQLQGGREWGTEDLIGLVPHESLFPSSHSE